MAPNAAARAIDPFEQIAGLRYSPRSPLDLLSPEDESILVSASVGFDRLAHNRKRLLLGREQFVAHYLFVPWTLPYPSVSRAHWARYSLSRLSQKCAGPLSTRSRWRAVSRVTADLAIDKLVDVFGCTAEARCARLENSEVFLE